jgi:type VI secretion system FHA domain protein
VDWPIADAAAELSRRHCVLAARDGAVLLRDTSANGVFIGVERRRAVRDAEIMLGHGEAMHLGQFTIVVDDPTQAANSNRTPTAHEAPFHAPLLSAPELSRDDVAVPRDWAAADAPPIRAQAQPLTNAALLEAFCAGAGLDASCFAAHDPAETMRRAGAVYRQLVLGLGDLMAERMSGKSELRMERTTVGAAGNNPFKWAPTQRVAVDLLNGANENFLSGPEALRASFEDLKRHLLGLMAGSRAALQAALDELSPARIESEAKPQPLLLMSKGEVCWRDYQRRHETLVHEARANADSAVSRGFRKGYESQLRQLEDTGMFS